MVKIITILYIYNIIIMNISYVVDRKLDSSMIMVVKAERGMYTCIFTPCYSQGSLQALYLLVLVLGAQSAPTKFRS